MVVVTSPQDLVRMIVMKAWNMCRMMKIPVLGLVENYSFFRCPDCGKEYPVFGESQVDEVAKELNVPVLSKLPLDPSFARMSDDGSFYEKENPLFDQAAEKLLQTDPIRLGE